MANRKIGKYEVIERLGRGGMAEVFRAYHSNLDRYVAIKVLHPFLADDPEFKSRFEREAQNVAKLRHPNIVQVYDFEYDPDSESYYMVMELVDGVTLKERLTRLSDRHEWVVEAEAIRIVREAALALAYAHSRSMIHRDVKPANLMIEHDDRVVLTDFGIAKIVTGAQFTASGGMVGTPAYMAPEQGLGEAGDERSDLYSLGIILFQLLTRKLPYEADTPLATVLKHLNTPIPSVRALNPEVSEDLEQVVHKSMAKEPPDRFQTASEFIDDINRFAGGILQGELASRTIPAEKVEAIRPPDVEPIQPAGVVIQDPVKAASLETQPIPVLAGSGRRLPWWGWVGGVLGLAAGIFMVLLAGGAFNPQTPTGTSSETPGTFTPAVVGAASASPGALTSTRLPNQAIDQTATVKAATEHASGILTVASATATLSRTPSPTASVTVTPSPTPTSTWTPSTTPSRTPTTTVSPTSTFTSTPSTPVAQLQPDIQRVVVRLGPGNRYPRVDDMRSGQVLTILGRSEDELWFRVITSNRTEGWVPVSVVEAAGNVGGLGVIPGPSNTPTNTPTVTPTPTWTVSPTTTLTSTVTYTPSPDVTATLSMATRIAVQQTRTAAACVWNYALVEQSPAGGEDNPVPANTSYRREITLQNTGNCAWEALTALVFMPNSGESFGAGPRIFIRERVEVGQTIVLVFEGLTPAKGALYQGRWELKTPGQVIIGDPLIISVRVFEQG